MLERLNEVQDRDLRLDALDAERAQVPEELLRMREERRRLRAAEAEQTVERDRLRSEVRTAERDLAALQERRKAASESALRADTAKEAAQFQNQELQFSTRAQELEEDAMPLMERLEEAETRLQTLQVELAEVEPRLEELEVAERERLAEIDAREGNLRAERDALAQEVQKPLLKQYDQVRKARRGLGLVPLVGGGSCGGCNVKLPIHVLQKAKRGGPAPVRCPSCGRILWVRDDG